MIVMCLYVYSLPNNSEFNCTHYREKKIKFNDKKNWLSYFQKQNLNGK